MKCPACNSLNPSDSQYCSECGISIVEAKHIQKTITKARSDLDNVQYSTGNGTQRDEYLFGTDRRKPYEWDRPEFVFTLFIVLSISGWIAYAFVVYFRLSIIHNVFIFISLSVLIFGYKAEQRRQRIGNPKNSKIPIDHFPKNTKHRRMR